MDREDFAFPACAFWHHETPMNNVIEQRRAALEQLSNDPLHMEEGTVAIVRGNNPLIAPLGTGTLFAVAGRYFVVTAGHVPVEASRQQSAMAISSATRGFVALSRPWIVATSANGDVYDRSIDVALYELNDSERAKLGSKKFLQLSDIALNVNWPTATFVAFGYPQMLCNSCAREEELYGLGGLKLMTGISKASAAGLELYDPNFHMLLDATDNGIFDENGKDTALKACHGSRPIPVALSSGLKGMSGCPVWRLTQRGQTEKRVKPDDWKLVGLLIGVYQETRIVKVTAWRAVVELIRLAFPDTTPALRLALLRVR
jgi:hypothetical protein